MTALSVVIPTYYRGKGLTTTIEAILRSDATGIAPVEVIIVDDGSPMPVKPVVERYSAPQFSVRVVSQTNAGPAAARNHGFAEASGKIVLFMDDDIEPSPGLLRAHCDAHERNPGTVIHGPCLLAENNGSAKLRRYLNTLSPDPDPGEEFVRMRMVASGQISVEKAMFNDGKGVYRTELRTPAAEEVELSYRLEERGIPILQATRILAIHHQPVEIRAICAQQYKHAIGFMEAVAKFPATAQWSETAAMLAQNGPISRKDSLATIAKKTGKRMFAGERTRKFLVAVLNPMAETLPFRISAPIFHALVGLHFFAGVRKGLSQFPGADARLG